MMKGWRIVLATNSSTRVKRPLTGRPAFLASSASTGSCRISFLPPKLPPTSVPITRIRLIGIFRMRAMSTRASVMRPIVAWTVRRPLASQSAIEVNGSIGACSIACVV